MIVCFARKSCFSRCDAGLFVEKKGAPTTCDVFVLGCSHTLSYIENVFFCVKTHYSTISQTVYLTGRLGQSLFARTG